jgi:phosphatidylinositol alpha-mannosyltransferase
VGLVCPYTFDVPGGVQVHVRDLAEALIRLGHEVSVLAPAADVPLPPYIVPAGRAVPVPFNGAVARMTFGPRSAARVRRWLREGAFDVLHLHEPTAPSLSMLACWAADGPIVATFHAASPQSRTMSAAHGILQPTLEKITARIAVSEGARDTLVRHLGGDAVLIPNGVSVRQFQGALPMPGVRLDGAELLGFVGRVDEPRKGLAVLLRAFARIADARPGLNLLVIGPGDLDALDEEIPARLRHRVRWLGPIDEVDKPRAYATADVFVAPNLGGESFGIVLLEAMAAGVPVLASDLDAFRAVLDAGRAGELFRTGDPEDLARRAAALLDDPQRRAELVTAGARVAQRYDWDTVVRDVLAVYETVAQPGLRVRSHD